MFDKWMYKFVADEKIEKMTQSRLKNVRRIMNNNFVYACYRIAFLPFGQRWAEFWINLMFRIYKEN